MHKLFLSIKEDAKKKKINGKMMAKKLNVSEGQMSNYFNLKNRMPFLKFVELVSYIYDQQDIIYDFLIKFARSTTKIESVREAIEWFSNHGDKSMVQDILNKTTTEDPLLQIYRLLLKRNLKEINPQELYIQIDKLKDKAYDCPEWKTLIRIASIYAFHDLKSYNMISFLAEDAMLHVNKIANDCLRKSYTVRILEIKSYSEMRKGNTNEAIGIANQVIDIGLEQGYEMTVNSLYILLSELYVFMDYKKSLYYINLAIDHFKKMNTKHYHNRKKVLESTHDFIKIHHCDFEGLYLNDPSEKAHYYAKMGGEENRKRALKIITQIEEEMGSLSSFQIYYKALATGCENDMLKAAREFIKAADQHYISLATNGFLNT